MRRIAVAVMIAAATLAQGAAAEALAVRHAWARATPPGSTVAAAYLTIDNAGGRSDRLLSIASPRARSAEVHAVVREGELVRMRKVNPLHVGAGERVALEPGGLHVMLMGLNAPLRSGGKLPLTLVFEQAGEIRVEAEILAADATDPHAGHDPH